MVQQQANFQFSRFSMTDHHVSGNKSLCLAHLTKFVCIRNVIFTNYKASVELIVLQTVSHQEVQFCKQIACFKTKSRSLSRIRVSFFFLKTNAKKEKIHSAKRLGDFSPYTYLFDARQASTELLSCLKQHYLHAILEHCLLKDQ